MSSFGEELKRERELREITLREISEATKINLRYLDALERNEFERLPGGVFNKGFVRAYAEYIGIDPETMVNAYLLEQRGRQSERTTGLSEDLFRPSPGSAVRHHGTAEPSADDAGRARLSRALIVLAAVAVVAGAAFFIWWWWASGPEPELDAGAAIDRPDEIETPEPLPKPSEAKAQDDAPAEESSVASMAPPPAPGRARSEPEVESQVEEEVENREEPGAPSGATGVPAVRLVLTRPTQGRVNCDNRRVEILDGLAAGTGMVFRCREFLLVDALDGGAVLVQPEGSEATPLGPDGLPVVGRYVVPAKPQSGGGEP